MAPDSTPCVVGDFQTCIWPKCGLTKTCVLTILGEVKAFYVMHLRFYCLFQSTFSGKKVGISCILTRILHVQCWTAGAEENNWLCISSKRSENRKVEWRMENYAGSRATCTVDNVSERRKSELLLSRKLISEISMLKHRISAQVSRARCTSADPPYRPASILAGLKDQKYIPARATRNNLYWRICLLRVQK